MRYLANGWKNISISKKLYLVVGVMAVLIACELLTLRFAMHTLSAARAFVGGESLWSKAQKNATFSLNRFGITRSEADYQGFVDALRIPEGDHEARIELLKPVPDLSVVHAGFQQGRIDEADIPAIIQLLRRFYWTPHLAKAIRIWAKGDELLAQLREAGNGYHRAVLSGDELSARFLLRRLKELNDALTPLEEEFSAVLGEGSRWLEDVVLTLLFLAVLTVESIGLTLTVMTSRSISRGLGELDDAASRIGRGDFGRTVPVRSRDEIGRLGEGLNAMSLALEKSYRDLERRVHERTSELERMAAQNAELYEQAKAAVEMRDEFLSIASHELKTPLTALELQLQLLSHRAALLPLDGPDARSVHELSVKTLASSRRLRKLLDELLDLTKIRLGRLELNPEKCDLVPIVCDTVSQLGAEAARVGSTIALSAGHQVTGVFDPLRVGQVVTNLLSNAIKYGNGKPIGVSVQAQEDRALIEVHDRGIGIPEDQRERIFERFERAETDPSITGLGLGLYISRRIIEAHGGRIKVESGDGEGSTFRVELPRKSV